MASPKVVVYTGPLCPYCVRAKRLLDERVVKFVEERSDGEREFLEKDLDHIRANYQLSPFANEPFRAQRILKAP